MVPFPSSCSVTLLLVILSGLLLWGWFLFRFFRFSLVSFIVFGSPVAWICAYSAVFSVFNRSFICSDDEIAELRQCGVEPNLNLMQTIYHAAKLISMKLLEFFFLATNNIRP